MQARYNHSGWSWVLKQNTHYMMMPQAVARNVANGPSNGMAEAEMSLDQVYLLCLVLPVANILFSSIVTTWT